MPTIEGVELAYKPGGDKPAVSPVLVSRSAVAPNRLFRNSHKCGDQFVRLREAACRAWTGKAGAVSKRPGGAAEGPGAGAAGSFRQAEYPQKDAKRANCGSK